MFYDKYIEFCNRIGKTPSAVAKEIGLNEASVTGWKKGSRPRDANLQKVANYFGVSTIEFIDTDEIFNNPEISSAFQKLLLDPKTVSEVNQARIKSALKLINDHDTVFSESLKKLLYAVYESKNNEITKLLLDLITDLNLPSLLSDSNVSTIGLTDAAIAIALAYQQADARTQSMVNLALEPFNAALQSGEVM